MNNNEERNKYYNSVYNKMVLILISLCGVILSCNYILFDFIFDQKYYLAYLYTPILVTSVIFCSISQFFGGIQVSLKRPKENGITTIIGAIVNIIIHITLIKFIGLYAAAISTMISNLTIVLLRRITLKKDMSIKLQNKNLIYIIVYMYLAISAYVYPKLPTNLNILNILIAGIMFIIINKSFIIKIFEKVLKLRKEK